MKILKYGEGYPKIVMCDNCKSELEYISEDINESETMCRVNDLKVESVTYRVKYLICPVCHLYVVLGKNVKAIQYQTETQSQEHEKPKKRRWKR